MPLRDLKVTRKQSRTAIQCPNLGTASPNNPMTTFLLFCAFSERYYVQAASESKAREWAAKHNFTVVGLSVAQVPRWAMVHQAD
jgi:hypothetical protein